MNHNMHINPITTGVFSDLKERQQIFVDALIDDGCSGYTVTRRQVVATAERCGYPGSFPWPSWLTADMNRRIDRGIFSMPELGDRVDTRSSSENGLPETMEYISNGLMAPDMTFSATCYNDGLDSVTMPADTIVVSTDAVSPGQETDEDGLADAIEQCDAAEDAVEVEVLQREIEANAEEELEELVSAK
jgi:hypothetical protein